MYSQSTYQRTDSGECRKDCRILIALAARKTVASLDKAIEATCDKKAMARPLIRVV